VQRVEPVAPIYQPEVPAEAIYWAAHHRELFVGAQGRQEQARIALVAKKSLRDDRRG
jgi:hypothetical protein